MKRNPIAMGLARDKPGFRPITVNPIQPFATINSDVTSVNFNGYISEPVAKSSAASNLLISNCGLSANGPFSLVDPRDNLADRGTLLTYQSMFSENVQANSSVQSTHSYLPLVISESEGQVSLDAAHSGAHVFEPWPEEEERKYEEMLRLLYDGSSIMGSLDPPVMEG